MSMLHGVWIAVAMLMAAPLFAQTSPAVDPPAENMRILREQLKADKKRVVTANLELTQAEAKAFWPVYEEYQKELHGINDRLAMLIVTYAKAHNANSLTDARALDLIERAIAVEEAEAKLKRAFLPKLGKVLPGRKAARYMQLENKIRAIVKYELAAEVPLAK
jgi:hypothetical protein